MKQKGAVIIGENDNLDIWAELEAEYVNSKISLRTLAEKHNVPLGTVQRHSSKGKWSEKRKKYAARKADKVSERVNDKEVNKTVKELQRLMKAAGSLLTMVNRAIGQLDQQTYISYDEKNITSSSVTDSDGVTVDNVLKKRKIKTTRMKSLVDTKRAGELAKAMANLKEILTGDAGQTEDGESTGIIEITAATALDPREDENESSMDAAT